MAKGIAVNGKRLRRIREARAMSQTRLGREAGVSTPTVSRIENGYLGSFGTVEKLARVLGVEPGLLLEETFEEVLATEKTGNGVGLAAAATGAASGEPIDLSDAAGVAYMDRVEAGVDGELLADEGDYFLALANRLREPENEAQNEAREWFAVAKERDLAWGLAALSRRDREEGAEAIRRVLRRLREEFLEERS